MLLVGGSLGDRFGRRVVFAIGVALFAVGSILCGFSPNAACLIAARGLQGIGAALLVPGSLAILSAFFPQETRGRAIGIWSGFSAVTAAVGPVLGGWLVDKATWRWVFFINVPLAVATLAITFWRVPESRNEQMHDGLDWSGATLGTLGLAGITFALIEAHRPGAGGLAHGHARLGCVAPDAADRVPQPHADAAAPLLPFAQLRRRQPAYAFPSTRR